MDDTAAMQPSLADFETRTFGDVTLVRGDCLDVMPLIERSSVSMAFADLPYQATKQAWDTAIDIACFWRMLGSALNEKKLAILTATHPFAVDVILSNRKYFRYDIIWQKSIATGHLNAKKMPLRSHESMLVFYKNLPTYNPQITKGNPYCFKHNNVNTSYGKQRIVERKNAGFRYPHSVLKISHGNRFSLHPTQKPVALLEWLIRTYTNDGDTILDPVAGSATTAIAAMNVGNRKVICIEKDPTYFEVMIKRVADHQKALADAQA